MGSDMIQNKSLSHWETIRESNEIIDSIERGVIQGSFLEAKLVYNMSILKAAGIYYPIRRLVSIIENNRNIFKDDSLVCIFLYGTLTFNEPCLSKILYGMTIPNIISSGDIIGTDRHNIYNIHEGFGLWDKTIIIRGSDIKYMPLEVFFDSRINLLYMSSKAKQVRSEMYRYMIRTYP